ncbi:hypothetical protein [uncultured Deinococcus sp.]|uniref:hypothetical protein n=1 Tax=uncultured Deinococcus sp. TaxID=158789 RepID=UPI0025F305AD|nr:hypothetical protein [uncultured Deinococcus sp.]
MNGDVAVLTDRAGAVTRVNLNTGQTARVTIAPPMDVVRRPGGIFAVTESGWGLRVLDTALRTTASITGDP